MHTHRTPHHQTIHHRFPIIGDRHATGTPQVADFRQFLPFRPFGDGPDRQHIRKTSQPGPFQNEFSHCLIVVHRTGIGHTADRRKSSRYRRCAAALNGFFIFESRFSKMHVQIHESRQNKLSSA